MEMVVPAGVTVERNGKIIGTVRSFNMYVGNANDHRDCR